MAILEQTNNGAALAQLLHVRTIHKKWSQVTRIRVSECSRAAVVNSIKECRVPIVRSIPEEMLVQPRDKLGSAIMPVERRMAAQSVACKLAISSAGEDSFAADVRERDAQPRWPEPNEVVVVAAHHARGRQIAASSSPGSVRQRPREQLLLYFAGDRELIFQPLALAAAPRSARRRSWSSR